MQKIARKAKCPCGSNKMYKKCCLLQQQILKAEEDVKYTKGQEISSENMKICLEYLSEEYESINHSVIDITDFLTNDNYKTFQIKNYTNKIIMVAEKNDKNKDVFIGRGQQDNDMIIMYRGSYRTFRLNDMELITDSIDKMIKTRLAGQEDK